MKEIIRKIEESDKLDFETKLLALCEIDEIMKGKQPDAQYLPKSNFLFPFLWTNTNLGFKFWLKIADKTRHL